MTPKILLLGKNGQVGWELHRALIPLGQIFAHDRTSCDLSHADSIEKALSDATPNIIVNAAAYTAVDRAEQEKSAAYQVNAHAVAQLADYAQRKDALLVHYSTDYVFDGSKEGAYVETDATNPRSVYGESKWQGEVSIIESGCAYLIFRTSWVFATRGANFAKTMLRLGLEKEELRVVSDQWGAPTSAELIADVTVHALRSAIAQKTSGLYHLAAGGETNWHSYASYVLERAQALGVLIKTKSIKAITTAEYPLPAARPHNSRLSTEKLKNTFNLNLPHWQYHVDRMLVELLESTNGIR